MTSIANSAKVANINFKIKIMLDCYINASTNIGQMMSIVQMNAFVLAACARQETDTAEVSYAKYIAGSDPELKEYVKDPIGYCRALAHVAPNHMKAVNGSILAAKIINPYPHLFAGALVNAIETSQKQALIGAEMMCKCITAEPRGLAVVVFVSNTIHKLTMVENSAMFLLEIMNESAKIACDYLPAEFRDEFKKVTQCALGKTNDDELLDKFADNQGASGLGEKGNNALGNHVKDYKSMYIICWVIKKMHAWIKLHGGNGSVKLMLKFHADLMLDLEDLFAEVIERSEKSPATNQHHLLFILPLLNALSGVIIASYCNNLDQTQIKQIQQMVLGYFAPNVNLQQGQQNKQGKQGQQMQQQNTKVYQTALSWVDALLFE